jgi:ribonuclease P protein component
MPLTPTALTVERLLRRADFLRVAGGRQKYVTPGLVLQALRRPDAPPRDTPEVRVGFTATKKVGNAVIRNRARRRLREAARATIPESGMPGCDYVVIARAGTLDRPFPALIADFRQALGALANRTKAL